MTTIFQLLPLTRSSRGIPARNRLIQTKGKSCRPTLPPPFLEPSLDEPVTYFEWDQVLSYIGKRQGSWRTPHLEELICDRTSPFKTLWQNGSSQGKIKWACDAVDFYDELLLLEKSADVQDRTALSSLKDKMTQSFKAMGIELLRESFWNPEIQRAISKKYYHRVPRLSSANREYPVFVWITD